MEVHIREVAALLEGRIEGPDEGCLDGFAGIEDAARGQLTFLANPAYESHLYTTSASAVLVAEDLALAEKIPHQTALIRVKDPYAAMAKLMQAFGSDTAPETSSTTIHPSAVVHEHAEIGVGVHIGPLCVVEAHASVADGCVLHAGVLIGEGARIGSSCALGQRSIVAHHCTLGQHCILQPGAVIGADGFGFAPTTSGYEKVPQLGNVILGDACEIGAGTTIDRATLGSTVLGQGVKLDNLIQIAHNVRIGDHTVIAAQTGVAGSTTIGAHCMIGGQVGINGHIHIADETKVAAKSGITASVTKPGLTLQGNPAKPIEDHQKTQLVLRRMVREFQKRQGPSPSDSNS